MTLYEQQNSHGRVLNESHSVRTASETSNDVGAKCRAHFYFRSRLRRRNWKPGKNMHARSFFNVPFIKVVTNLDYRDNVKSLLIWVAVWRGGSVVRWMNEVSVLNPVSTKMSGCLLVGMHLGM